MKNFHEYALEKALNEFAADMGRAFVGGMIQGARGQQLDIKQARDNPFQTQQSHDQEDWFDQQNTQQPSQHWKKYLTGQGQKQTNVQQWWGNQKNVSALQQHYSQYGPQGVSRMNQDMHRLYQNWSQDDQQMPNSWGQYVQQQLKLPQGSFS